MLGVFSYQEKNRQVLQANFYLGQRAQKLWLKLESDTMLSPKAVYQIANE
jgi:hypothetical protein